MISIDEAFAHLDDQIGPLPARRLPLREALGRALAEEAFARIDLPPFRQSAMDGYAVALADLTDATGPLRLAVTATSAAGPGGTEPLLPGSCQRIFTGARVPEGADLVIRQEDVERGDDAFIGISSDAATKQRLGANIREAGEELARGAVVGRSGHRLTHGAIGALAMAGLGSVSVHRAPRVALLVTGDELRDAQGDLEAGMVFDANSPLLAAWAARQKVEVVTAASLPDDAELLTLALSNIDADLIITTGGASVGDRDHLRASAAAAGFTEHFWGVAQQPGKPTLFATRRTVALLGLPGNPAAVFAGLATFGARLLSRLEGERNPAPFLHSGRLTSTVRPNPARDLWLRCALVYGEDGSLSLQPLGKQSSHMLSNLLDCDALARIPAADQPVAAGSVVTWLRP
jgi:molybdopterin molybdotransferase